jgi:hypothetical protein
MSRCPIEAGQSRDCPFLENGECCNGIVYADPNVCNIGVRSQSEETRNFAMKLLVLQARLGGLGERGKLVREKLESFSN